ncbi:MAG: hypothetical protein M1827_000762 [Pycnora praestabilis]|nr:MAG: hypothetical protein M1827_000762 [Pycnora praestabilis]
MGRQAFITRLALHEDPRETIDRERVRWEELAQINNLCLLRILEYAAEDLESFAPLNWPEVPPVRPPDDSVATLYMARLNREHGSQEPRRSVLGQLSHNVRILENETQAAHLDSPVHTFDSTASLEHNDSADESFLGSFAESNVLIELLQGRSAYEAPENTSSVAEGGNGERRTNNQQMLLATDTAIDPEHYAQRYDARGHASNLESRSMSRALIRAQNDVLATVGVCVGVRPDKKLLDGSPGVDTLTKPEKAKVESVMKENEIGLFLAAADSSLFFLGLWGARGLRNRLQVFRSYSDTPLHLLFISQRKHYGWIGILFGGMPAFLVAHLLLHVGFEFLIDELQYFLTRRLNAQQMNRKQRRIFRKAITWLDYSIKIGSFMLISPIYMFSILQTLHLIPLWPLLPPLRSLIPFSPYSPIQPLALPQEITGRSLFTTATALISSPVAVFLFYTVVKERIDDKIFVGLRRAIPKPDHPDVYSIKGAMEDDLDSDSLPGILLSQTSKEQTRQAGRNTGEIPDVLCKIRDTFLAFFGQPASASDSGEPHQDAMEAATTVPESTDDISVIRHPPSLPVSEAVSTVLSSSNAETTTSEQDLPSSSEESTTSQPLNSVRLSSRHRSADAEAVTMEVELSNSPPAPMPAPVFTEALSASPTPSVAESGTLGCQGRRGGERISHHRVTCLSGYPADAMANHVSTHAGEWLEIPLEVWLLRTIALSFLAAAATPSQQAGAAVVGLDMWKTWGYGMKGMGAYVGRLGLCFVMESVVGIGLWQAGYRVTRLIGKWWFEWGKL